MDILVVQQPSPVQLPYPLVQIAQVPKKFNIVRMAIYCFRSMTYSLYKMRKPRMTKLRQVSELGHTTLLYSLDSSVLSKRVTKQDNGYSGNSAAQSSTTASSSRPDWPSPLKVQYSMSKDSILVYSLDSSVLSKQLQSRIMDILVIQQHSPVQLPHLPAQIAQVP